MQILAPGFLLGCFLLFHFRILPHLIPMALMVISLFLAYLCCQSRWICFFLSIFLGMAWVVLYAKYEMPRPLPVDWAGKKITLPVRIVSVNQDLAHYCNIDVKSSSIRGTIRLSSYQTCPGWRPGEAWRMTVKLKRPRGLSNPGTFDKEAWAIENQVVAIGYIVSAAPDVNQKMNFLNLSLNAFNQIRQAIAKQQEQVLPKNQGADFIPALTIGYRSQLTQPEWEVLQKTGTNHLVAIAGLHIGMVTGLIFFMVDRVVRFFPRLLLWMPASLFSAYISLFFAFIYSGLAGFSLPTQRAFIMLTCFFLALIFRRRLPPWHAYSLALFLVVFMNPGVVVGMSFWLSFWVVGVIIFSFKKEMADSRVQKVKNVIKLQLAISLGILPLTVLFFQQISLVSPIVNMIVVPVVGFVVIPIALAGSALLFVNHWAAAHCLWLSSQGMQIVWLWMSLLSRLPGAGFYFSATHWVGVFLFLAGVLWLFTPYCWPYKKWAWILFLPLFFPVKKDSSEGEFFFTMLDVGQGLATVVETKHHVLIFDSGPKMPDGFDAGRDVVLPFLRTRFIRQVDLMMISHADNDHVGGSASIYSGIHVKSVSSSAPLFFPKPWGVRFCERGQSWVWDGVRFRVLFPYDQDVSHSKNDRSCVLRISTRNKSLLLTGDIEKSAEKSLLEKESELKSNLLQVPHHGSKTSSTASFVTAVHPEYALFSLGYLNRFHFPSSIVVLRYKMIGAHYLDTDHCGAVKFVVTPINISKPICYRDETFYWWRF